VALNAASGEGSLWGDFLLLCGIACAAVNGLIARRVAQSGANPGATTTYQMSSAVLLGLAVMLFMSVGDSSGGALPFAELTSSSLALLFYLGVAATAGPFFLLNYAMKYLPIARTSLFSCLIGPFAMPMAAFLLGEEITPLEIAAVAIVLFAVLLPSMAVRWMPAASASSGD
jgi:drug/metabolite transporter (DMT)-like permease